MPCRAPSTRPSTNQLKLESPLRGTSETMSDIRTIYVGRKQIHVYVAAVLNAMQDGDRNIEIVARGNAMQRAIDTAEICRCLLYTSDAADDMQ